MIRIRLRVIPTLVAAVLFASGCGAIMDTTYAIGDKTYTSSASDRRPTEHSEQWREYEVLGDSSIQCFDRTRAIERNSRVTKTFEYRGGYDKTAYGAAIGLDGAVGALIAGSLLAVCASEDSDTSCMNMLWASPFAIDLIYSVVRYKSVRNPVLIKKSRSADALVYATQPSQEEQVDCGGVESVWLGTATGPSRSRRLNSGGDEQVLDNDALPLPIDSPTPDLPRRIEFSEEAARHWSENNYLQLWVKTNEGAVRPIIADRCTMLRPFAHTFGADARRTYDASCPLPGQVNSAQQ